MKIGQLELNLMPAEDGVDTFVLPTNLAERAKLALAILKKLNENKSSVSPKELAFLNEERARQTAEDSEDLERTYRVKK